MNNYYEYKTVEGDTFDSIALKFYDNEFKSSDIINANPNYIKTLIFKAGVTIKVPVLEIQTSSTLPPWKR